MLTRLDLLMGNAGAGVVLSGLCGWQLGSSDNFPDESIEIEAGPLVLMKIKSLLPWVHCKVSAGTLFDKWSQ